MGPAARLGVLEFGFCPVQFAIALSTGLQEPRGMVIFFFKPSFISSLLHGNCFGRSWAFLGLKLCGFIKKYPCNLVGAVQLG